MAKVKDPLFSSDARGKVGGIVFSKAKQGSTVRIRTNPSQPQTADQLLVRGYLSQASQNWAALTAQQRTDWAEWAALHPVTNAFGDQVYLSGHQAYCSLAAVLLALGKSLPTTPPAVGAPTNVANIVATPGAGQVSLAFTAKAGTNMSIAVADYGPHSPGIAVKRDMADLVGYFPAETSPKVLSSLSPGLHTMFVYVVSEDDGQRSTMTKISFTVT